MKCLRLLAAAAFFLAAGSASAQTGIYFFAGAGAGNPKFDEADFDLFGIPRKTDSTDTTYHLGVGYRFSAHWAAEVGVAHLGDYSHDHSDFVSVALSERYEVRGIKTAVVGNWPSSTDPFFFFGKLGIATTEVTNEISGTIGGAAFSARAEKKHNSLLAGFGAQYNITRSIGVRAEYESWGEVGNESDTGRAKMGTWNLLGVLSF